LRLIKLFPGIIFLLIVGLIAKYFASFIPYVSHLVLAIGMGLLISNIQFIKVPSFIEIGISKTYKLWLMTGIVILGSVILLNELLLVGPYLLAMILFFLIFSLIIVETISKRFSLEPKLGSCLASGTSVCGVSAIIATGGGIGAKEKHMAISIATILIFDVTTVFLYPVIAEIFSIPVEVYGPWAGISMFSTGTAVAAGFSVSETAGQIATMAKMARNIFIGVWALGYTLFYVSKGYSSAKVENKALYLWDKFPKFVIGFIITMIIANLGFLSEDNIESIENTYNWLFMMSFVGLGYNIKIKELKQTGIKPLLTVLISFSIISLTVLIFSYIIFG